MAMESGVPVAPLTIVGAYEMWPKGEFAIYPGTATLIVHEPIDPKNFPDRDALMSAVRTSIESGLPEKYRSTAVGRHFQIGTDRKHTTVGQGCFLSATVGCACLFSVSRNVKLDVAIAFSGDPLSS